MRNKVTVTLLALGFALPVVSLQAQDSAEKPAREGRGPRGDRPVPGLIGALDANKDGTLDKTEISGATDALKKLDKDSDGKLTVAELRGGQGRGPGEQQGGARGRERGPRNESEERAGQRPQGGDRPMGGPPFMVALDANKNGTIDADELTGAPAALLKLDKNSDGQLTMDELQAGRGGRAGGPAGERGGNREGRGPRGDRQGADKEKQQ
jgi:hypothetical protein